MQGHRLLCKHLAHNIGEYFETGGSGVLGFWASLRLESLGLMIQPAEWGLQGSFWLHRPNQGHCTSCDFYRFPIIGFMVAKKL